MKQTDNIKRISLWSGPRNISTTLMYSFAQRSDTKVIDEPFYAHYLSNSKAVDYHPGAADVLSSMEKDGDKVIESMLSDQDKPVIFFKNMSHHLLDLDRSFLKSLTNVLLSRDPVEMLPSYAEVIENPKMEDVGYALHVNLISYFQSNQIPYVVLDSTKVLLNPEEQMQKLCAAIGIPFEQAMLSWEKGSRKEDGVWAKYWYKNIHNSTGFKPYKPKTKPFPRHLKPLLTQCIPYYEVLKDMAL